MQWDYCKEILENNDLKIHIQFITVSLVIVTIKITILTNQNQNWQYFIERVIEVCKSKEIGSTIRKSEDFLLNTVENVTIAKKSYETFYNVVARNFYSTMNKLPIDERDKIKDDFLRENFWAENVVTELDCWISFYFQHGRFPGSQNLISIPKVILPVYHIML